MAASSPSSKGNGCPCTSLLTRLLDLVLLLVFLFLSIVIPLFDAQTTLGDLVTYPAALTDLNRWYADEYGDYLVTEKPHFFRGLIWAELLLLWPLSVAGSYAGIARKPWFREVCLVAGISMGTSMSAIASEMLGSGRASDKLLKMYAPFAVFPVLAVLRRLLPCPARNKGSPTPGYVPLDAPRTTRKKRA